MRILKKSAFLTVIVISLILTSCASKYNLVSPDALRYSSRDNFEGIELEYKYSLLDKKYAKKETNKGIRLIALKITNNTDSDLIFGQDFTLSYTDGADLVFLEKEEVFSSLKQQPATHLLYLLLSPLNIYTYETDSYGYQETTWSFPIGLIIGPGLAIGNLLAASSANTKFKNDLKHHEVLGTLIKKGETKSGLIGVKSSSYDAIIIKLNKESLQSN